jgi:hypothetical protein
MIDPRILKGERRVIRQMCSKCRKLLLSNMFYRCTANWDGLSRVCKKCNTGQNV